MAEQVQSILERMVIPLKDLRSRNIFTPSEIQHIVNRRRRSEYTLQRRSGAVLLSDYLTYIEEEVQLEQLRKLRKEKVLLEWNDKVRHRSSKDSDDEQQQQQQAVYKTSGPGDSHIISHIHFLYQRTLRKFQYPLDVLLTYANFAKDTKGFKVLSYIYAMGIQYHPRVVGLWIEAANFEYFGYVAQDYETTTSGNEGNESRSSNIHTKIVGSSIRNARILLQRGLRINKCSIELWIQYFTLELHYVQKLHGRKEILTNNKNDEGGEEGEEEEGSRDGNNNDTDATTTTTKEDMDDNVLLPLRVIYQNAIKSIPSDIQLRLRFIEICSLFPRTQSLVDTIMTSISVDFRHSVQGWVARISYANDKWKESRSSSIVRGVTNNVSKGFNDNEGDEESSQPKKKARVDNKDLVFANHNVLISHDPALTLLHEALMTVPTPRMYLEGARFLRMRFHLLYNSGEDDDNDNDVNYLLKNNEDVHSATTRYGTLLTELYDNAKKKNVLSTTLILDHVDWIMNVDNVDSANTAECILRNAIDSSKDAASDDARLWLQWAEIADHKSISMTSVDILRRGLKSTPLHHRRAHTLLLTELMKRLMSQHNLTSSSFSSKVDDELKGLFQKLILLSQGSDYSISYVKKMKCNDDTGIDEEILEDGVEVNITSTVLAYLNYTISNITNNSDNNKGEDKKDAVRSIYTCVLYQSNYYKSCIGKSNKELHNMKKFFDVCLQYEVEYNKCHGNNNIAGKKKESKKKSWKIRVMKLYEKAISFYTSAGDSSEWKNVVNGYRRDLDSFNYGC
jgi:U3 small nucleolar RNA-associated protein 6